MVRMSPAGREENLFFVREGPRKVAKKTYYFFTKGREEQLLYWPLMMVIQHATGARDWRFIH